MCRINLFRANESNYTLRSKENIHWIIYISVNDDFCDGSANNYIDDDVHVYNTINRNNFHPPLFRTELSKSTICYQGPVLWNDVPVNLKKLKSPKQFNCNYKRQFFIAILNLSFNASIRKVKPSSIAVSSLLTFLYFIMLYHNSCCIGAFLYKPFVLFFGPPLF